MLNMSLNGLLMRLRRLLNPAVKKGRLSPAERRRMIKYYTDSMNGYTYFEHQDHDRLWLVKPDDGAQQNINNVMRSNMSIVLVIGAGGVGSVAVHKMAMLNEQFHQITLASRRQFKCDEIAASVNQRTGIKIATAELDADDVDATARLIDSTGAKLVVNLALPYQDLTIMDACLKAGADYLDTANYEPRDEAKFEYHWQWAIG